MIGRSGSAVADHTPLAFVGSAAFAVSAPQARIIREAMDNGGVLFVSGQQPRSARTIPSAVGTLGSADLAGDEFVLVDGVQLRFAQ